MGPTAAEFVAEIIPLRRFGTKADIGLTAVFLARHATKHGQATLPRIANMRCSPSPCGMGEATSSAGSYITGETIVVDGGQWLWKPAMGDREVIREVSRRCGHAVNAASAVRGQGSRSCAWSRCTL